MDLKNLKQLIKDGMPEDEWYDHINSLEVEYGPVTLFPQTVWRLTQAFPENEAFIMMYYYKIKEFINSYNRGCYSIKACRKEMKLDKKSFYYCFNRFKEMGLITTLPGRWNWKDYTTFYFNELH